MDTLERLDGRSLDPRPGEILLVTCVRNESVRLPYFLEYHRALGVDRILAIDNRSDDGSTELLLSQPDTHVFRAERAYSQSQWGVAWMNEILGRYAIGHWALTLDADELLIYPDSEDVGLRPLVAHLENAGADALSGFLLDMYSDRPIRSTHYAPGTPFLTACPFFDRDSYLMGSDPPYDGLPIRGGVRPRLFWGGRREDGPFLGKTAFVKWRRDLAYRASTHFIENVRTAPTTSVLLHFKLFSDFVAHAPREAARGEHWGGAVEYRAYAAALANDADLCGLARESERYTGTRQLEGLGLLRRGPDFP